MTGPLHTASDVVRSLRDAFGEALAEAARDDSRIVGLDADLAPPTRMARFASEFPDRFVEVGIAEQNMIGLAAGLATVGFVPFACTFATFMSKRVCDQVAISVAYPRLNVKLVGAYSGLFAGKTGATHLALQDCAILRSMPHMTVLTPADDVSVRAAVRAAVATEGPVYIRVARDAYPRLFPQGWEMKVGKADVIYCAGERGPAAATPARARAVGAPVVLVAMGDMTWRACKAAEGLEALGVRCCVVCVTSLKPLDSDLLCDVIGRARACVTCENHSVIGGLGSAVAELIAEGGLGARLCRVGVADAFGESGPDPDLEVKYRISVEDIQQAALRALGLSGRTS